MALANRALGPLPIVQSMWPQEFGHTVKQASNTAQCLSASPTRKKICWLVLCSGAANLSWKPWLVDFITCNCKRNMGLPLCCICIASWLPHVKFLSVTNGPDTSITLKRAYMSRWSEHKKGIKQDCILRSPFSPFPLKPSWYLVWFW